MAVQRRYPQELRERMLRLVEEARKEGSELSLNGAVIRIAQCKGVNADTLRSWVRQAAVNSGQRPGTTTDDAKKIKDLEAEVLELKRANEIFWRRRISSRESSTRDCRGSSLY